METISYGPVIHEDKPIEFSMGFSAYMMGHRRTNNPFNESAPYQEEKHSIWDAGWVAAENAKGQWLGDAPC